MWAGCVLVVANIAMYALKRLDPVLNGSTAGSGPSSGRRPPAVPALRRIVSDEVNFSGDALESGKFWVWVTASLSHASMSHLVNNMLMMIPVMGDLEAAFARTAFGSAALGGALLIALYAGTGMAGWALTLRYNRSLSPELWDAVVKFQSSCGSSPATYGLVFCLACAAPGLRVSATLGLPSWAWVWLVWFAPAFCTHAFGVGLFAPGRPPKRRPDRPIRPKRPYVMLLCCAAGFLAFRSACADGVTASGWLALYIGKSVFHRTYVKWVLGMRGSGSDDHAHLGGSIGGVLAAYALVWADNGSRAGQCTDVGMAMGRCSPEQMRLRVVFWTCMAYVVYRAWTHSAV